MEICFELGKDIRIKSIDFTNYNPLVEDYRSGYFLSNMIYYFILGTSQRIN